MGEFDGQVCVVTGGSRGLGAAIVAMLAGEGAEVHALDLSPPLEPVQPAVRFHRSDITDLAAVEQVFAGIDRVDVLVNNAAAVTPPGPITTLAPEDWARALSVNLTGTFHMARLALPRMGRGGRIINLASTFAHVGSPGRVAYSTTKGAILAFTRSLALDVAADGIRVNSISPGGIATDRLVELFGSEEKAADYLVPLHPIGRTGQPSDIADAVFFLASRRSSFMTGADLLVDGGYTAQ